MSGQDLSININSNIINNDIVLTLLHQKLLNTTNELKQKTTELDQKTTEYNHLVAENNRQKATIESNEKLIAELQVENKRLLAEIATLTAKVAQLEAENKQLQEKYDTLKQEHEVLKQEHKVLKQEHETLKVEHNTLRTEFNESKRRAFNVSLITAIQDLNATDRLEDKFANPTKKEMKKIRCERNGINHYTCVDDINENTVKYRYSILKQKMQGMSADDIEYFNIMAGSYDLHEKILEYLIENYSENYTVNNRELKFITCWWN